VEGELVTPHGGGGVGVGERGAEAAPTGGTITRPRDLHAVAVKQTHQGVATAAQGDRHRFVRTQPEGAGNGALGGVGGRLGREWRAGEDSGVRGWLG
jgi:hypothetical protein